MFKRGKLSVNSSVNLAWTSYQISFKKSDYKRLHVRFAEIHPLAKPEIKIKTCLVNIHNYHEDVSSFVVIS